jgi:hypothetical protein
VPDIDDGAYVVLDEDMTTDSTDISMAISTSIMALINRMSGVGTFATSRNRVMTSGFGGKTDFQAVTDEVCS